MKTHCEGCPVDPGRICLGVESPATHGDFCEWADAGATAHQEQVIRERSAIGIRPGAAESLILLNRMKACPHRTDEANCGCAGLARCALGKGRDGLVNHIDCFACLQAPVSGT